MLSRRVVYALRAVQCLARSRGEWVLAAQMAEQESLPRRYVDSILLSLARSGIVESKRGSQGGYRLGLPPDTISIAKLVLAVEGRLLHFDCLDPVSPHTCSHCPRREACSAARIFAKLDDAFVAALAPLSLADLCRPEPQA